jgi:PAS domain S-box-containing protein
VIVTDADALVTRMNPIAEELTGWTIGEAQGKPLAMVFDIVNEITRKTVENPVEKVQRLGIIVGLANHTVLLRRDGTETHIDDSSAPIWDPTGELTGIVLVFRDINARKEAEAFIKASDEKLTIALETAQLGSWELQLSDMHMECSNVCKMNYGRAASEAFDYQDLWMTVHPEDRDVTEAAVKDAIRTRGVYRAEYRVIWPDSSLHWIVASGRVLLGDHGEPKQMVGVILDVTDRHLAAEALIKTEKLAAVGRLASSIAHEINNPLESVTNLLYLARHASNGGSNAEYIDAAERELKRVSVIANQTLRFHKQSTFPSVIDAREIMDSVLSMFQGKIFNSRIAVEQRQRSRSRIVCFEGEIRQVVSNLIGNAIDALPAGGRLLVRSHDGSAPISREPGCFITVADNGSGMSKQTIEKAFEPFFTTKGIVGTGLGLWISHEIVGRHGGAIRVRSRQQHGRNGTVFQVFLPLCGRASSS